MSHARKHLGIIISRRQTRAIFQLSKRSLSVFAARETRDLDGKRIHAMSINDISRSYRLFYEPDDIPRWIAIWKSDLEIRTESFSRSLSCEKDPRFRRRSSNSSRKTISFLQLNEPPVFPCYCYDYSHCYCCNRTCMRLPSSKSASRRYRRPENSALSIFIFYTFIHCLYTCLPVWGNVSVLLIKFLT